MRIWLWAAFAAMVWVHPAGAYLPPPEVLLLHQQASLGSEVEEGFVDPHVDDPWDGEQTFRGYTHDLWDEMPTFPTRECSLPGQEACLVEIETQMDSILFLEYALYERIAREQWEFYCAPFVPVGDANYFRFETPALASAVE